VEWQDEGVGGIYRFLGKVYRYVVRNAHPDDPNWDEPVPSDLTPEARAIQRKLHQTIKRVSTDFQGRWHFNTSIAAIMELVNELTAAEGQIASGTIPAKQVSATLRTLVLMLAPFAPYLASELWEGLGQKSELLRESWPKF